MTSPLPVKVPTKERVRLQKSGWLIVNPYGFVWHEGVFVSRDAAQNYLNKFWQGNTEQTAQFRIAPGTAIYEADDDGLRLSADEPAAQHPSDLVKRLRSISLPPSMAVVQSWITEAADRIEALEAAAAQPSEREKALYDIRWTRDDGELLECHGLTARTVFSRLRGAIANSGPITVHSIEPAAYTPAKPDACEHEFSGWRKFPDGNGGEQFCPKCGLGAMANTLRTAP